MIPQLEQLENRDVPSSTPVAPAVQVQPIAVTLGGVIAPPVNPATAAPAYLAMMDFDFVPSIHGNVGFGQTSPAVANAYYQAQYNAWYNAVEPNGQRDGDVWNASAQAIAAHYAQSAPALSALYLSYIQTPPPGETYGPGVALPETLASGVNQPTTAQLIQFHAQTQQSAKAKPVVAPALSQEAVESSAVAAFVESSRHRG